jgi:GH15 family glucan-1,4-alpha-glucosidase
MQAPTGERGPRVASRIEDYAMIGDMHSAALVSRGGSIDWLCWPRFDADACFAALLGSEDHGHWTIAPAAPVREVRRRYRPDTLILETELAVDGGSVRLIDCMPPRNGAPDLIRIVEGVAGEVTLRARIAPRFGYGDRRPWIQRAGELVTMTSAPDALALWSSVPLAERDGGLDAELRIRQGERASFVLEWYPAHERAPAPYEPGAMIADTEAWWREWSGRCTYDGPWRDAVRRSLITLKALTYAPTGGIVAAPTTSLPEKLGGVRNWDYRFCWLRDATFTLYALLDAGYRDEARAFGGWLERAAAGQPARLQMLYGALGERRLTELELPWLPGYAGSAPVRIGNAASTQLQLDVYGEIIDCFHHARSHGVPPDQQLWDVQRALLDHLEEVWREPDEGIWEVRGPRLHLTHSKVMVWVAFDRMIRDAESLGLDAPVARWRRLREEVHADVCANAFDAERRTFTRAYGSRELDASLLLLPLVGFLTPGDPRVRTMVDAIRRELCHGGLVLRYDTSRVEDGLPPGEGVFLPCSFWLADVLELLGDHDAAGELFERLLGLCNDVGLLSEEIDPDTGRMLGNFPQGFSHLALVNTAINLSRTRGLPHRRSHE